MTPIARRGFTLVELLVVIAIIAIIAAIAIPGLLASQRAGNERSASATLKTVSVAEADFRGSDRDVNKAQDFWCGDVAGLYAICPPDTNEMLKLLEQSVAGADHHAIDKGTTPPAATPTTGAYTGQTFYATRSPKAGYWFRAMQTDSEGLAYGNPSGSGVGLTGSYFNGAKFGVECYPDSRMAGRNVFIVSEGNTIFKRGLVSTYAVPATDATLQGLSGSTTNLTRYPTENLLKSDYSKLD